MSWLYYYFLPHRSIKVVKVAALLITPYYFCCGDGGWRGGGGGGISGYIGGGEVVVVKGEWPRKNTGYSNSEGGGAEQKRVSENGIT